MKERNPKFENKDGSLTAYAFACGYIQTFEKDGYSVSMWHEGGPCYHVRLHDHGISITQPNGPRFSNGRIFWQSEESMSKMKALYNRTVTQLKKNNFNFPTEKPYYA